MRHLGILGGTFDPIHYGHLRSAVEVRAALGLDGVRLIPCRVSPHRTAPLASGAQRLAMVRAAVEGAPDLCADRREIDRPGPSYTADTLAAIGAEAPDARLYLVIGADTASAFERWHRWREVLDQAHLVVTTRPGFAPDLSPALRARRVTTLTELRARRAGAVWFQPVTELAISATGIRRLAAAGGDLRFLLPAAVEALIREQALYTELETAIPDGDRTAG